MHVLATVGENTCSPVMSLLFIHGNLRMGDHPIVWLHCIGTGGAFYSAIGHAASTYSEPKHLKLLEGGIAWAARLEGASCENRSESAPQ